MVAELSGLSPTLLRAVPRLAAAAAVQAKLTGVQGYIEIASQTTAALLSVPQQLIADGRLQPPTCPSFPAANPFRFDCYCLSPRQLRAAGYPPGCAQAAVATSSPGAPLPPLPPGWVCTLQQPHAPAAGEAGLSMPASIEFLKRAAHAAVILLHPASINSMGTYAHCHCGSFFFLTGNEPRQLAVAALDVESVLTTAGYEAARVTLLDGAGRRVLDGLVLPEHPVVDYVSQKSGERVAAAASRWWWWAVRDRRAGQLQPVLGTRRWCL